MDVTVIIRMSRNFLYILPVLLIIVAVLYHMRFSGINMNEKGNRRKHSAYRIKKNAVKIGIVSLLYIICFIGVNYLDQRISGYITVGLNYAEASQGLNPNGTRFNSYDIIDDDVLSRAIEIGNMGDISVEKLRKTLTVEPVQASNSISLDQYYVSTEYLLSYHASSDTIWLQGSNVVESVAAAYEENFSEIYTRKTDVLEMDFSNLDEADYLDKVDILETEASNLQSYLWILYQETGNYTYENSETFASLANKIQDYQSVEMERLESYILTKGISNNTGRQLAKLNYENLISDITYQKNLADYNVRLETIDMYERDMASIVLVPTRDEEGEFYMSRTKIAVDDFADEADQSSQSAALIKQEIDENKYAIQQLSSETATESDYETIDQMISSITSTLYSYSDRAVEMINSYDEEHKGDFLIFSKINNSAMLKQFAMRTLGMCFVMMLALCLFCVLTDKRDTVK